MENMNPIDENQYFVESKKAIQIVLNKEQYLAKQMPTADKLRLLKEHKESTKSPEEYEDLEKLEKELEKKIRFNQLTEPAVPEEYRETLKRNAVVEKLEVDNKLNELKAELKDRIEYLENELVPLIDNIRQLEKMSKIPNQIDAILDLTIGEGAPVTANYRLQLLTQTNDETQAGEAQQALSKVIKSLKKIEVPIETKGLLNFLKRGKK